MERWLLQFDKHFWASKRVGYLLAVLLLLITVSLPLAGGGTIKAIAGETATSAMADDAGGVDKTEAYMARLREAVPESWFEQEFRRQRSFPALARSRQLAAAGKYDEAVQELADYIASDPRDLVMQFEYLILAANIKRYRAAISAADMILSQIPKFTPALFYRGLAHAALGDNKDALPDLAAAGSGGELSVEDTRYAQRSLAWAALASPEPTDAFAVVDREAAKPGADLMLLLAKGQLLERLARPSEAAVVYDEAAKRAGNPDDGRAALVLGAELALKQGDTAGALARARSMEIDPGQCRGRRGVGGSGFQGWSNRSRGGCGARDQNGRNGGSRHP